MPSYLKGWLTQSAYNKILIVLIIWMQKEANNIS